MKIQDLVFDVVLEQFKSKSQFDKIVRKWFGENPTQEQIKKAENLITVFMAKQKGLQPNNPIVYSFLSRFDGSYPNEFPIFDPKNLKDPFQYTLSQMESLIEDFVENQEESEGSVFAGNKNSNIEKIKASYELWSGDDYKIIDEGTLRVYYIPDQKVAMRFGYYMQSIVEWDSYRLSGNNKEEFNNDTKKEIPFAAALKGEQWCVTGRGTSDSRSNLWGTYRPTRTFYFVIDESKTPNSEVSSNVSRYYISALQVDTSLREGYRITSVLNDGDIPMTWEEVVRIYPQLSEHKEEIKPVKYNEDDELENKDILGRITETEGAKYEFKKLNKKYKRAFIERASGSITKSDSWRSMDDELRTLYIITTTDRNVKDKFKTIELMNEIRKKGSEFNLLNKRLTQLGLNGVGYIYNHLMSTEFDTARVSLDNENILLYRSKTTYKYGLFDAKNAKWVTSDGITFEPNYGEIDNSLYVDDNGELYIVETLSEFGEPTSTSLYIVVPQKEENQSLGGHFITQPKFESLKQKIRPSEEGSDLVNISDFNPETDVDIKEIKKGL